MKTLEGILKKESRNTNYIYLYCIDDAWTAFGQSARYLSLLYPELDMIEKDMKEIQKNQICIPDEYFLKILEEMHVLAGNDYIQMEMPVVVLHKIKAVIDK